MDTTSQTTRSYRVLSHEEREEIMVGKRAHESIRSIAGRLGRNPSVVSREIHKNSTEDGRYQAYWAHSRSARRRSKSRQRVRIADPRVRKYVRDKLELGWSPEQIAGRIRMDRSGLTVSHETIYQYVFKVERPLTEHLVCGRKRRRKRVNKKTRRVMIPERTSLEERPQQANDRSQIGHWEADTAVSRASKATLVVLQERALGLTLLEKTERCAPAQMNAAVEARLSGFAPQLLRSITFDNGQENRRHAELHTTLGVSTYFCDPYSSWQKGSVENAIGLTRRVWPKGTDYGLISKEEVATMEYRLNTRPRKRFGYLTPLEHALRVALTP